MSDAQSRLELEPAGDDFILSCKSGDGETMKIALSAADILALTKSALAIRERSLARRQPASGEVEAVLATPVAEIGLNREALGDAVLVTMVSTDGNRLSFALPSALAGDLAERISALLRGSADAAPSRQ